MRIITNLRHLTKKFRSPVVAIGIFDGIHLGHKKILRRAVGEARRIGGTSIVLTFNPHPRGVLDAIGMPPLLVSLKHRLNLISKEGLDVACVLNFDEAFAGHEAQDFVKDILVKKLGVKKIIIGANFRFGKGKVGNLALLRRMGKAFGFSVTGIRLFKIGRAAVSSTRIRVLIMRGELERASRLLGRPISVLGTVVEGRKRGRLLGYPTANIDPHHEAIPPSGVYAVYVIIGQKRYRGILNIGVRPTFDKKNLREPTIEAHIFGFNKNIYGKDVEVIFVKRLRPEIKFSSRQALINQIRIDEHKARMVL